MKCVHEQTAVAMTSICYFVIDLFIHNAKQKIDITTFVILDRHSNMSDHMAICLTIDMIMPRSLCNVEQNKLSHFRGDTAT